MKQKLPLLMLLIITLCLLLNSQAEALGSGRVDGYANAFLTGSAAQPVGVDVAVVPDMNGDGYDELAIGASSPNRVYVILGGPDGWGLNLRLATTPSVIVYTGDNVGDLAGYGVAGVGDVNGDGFGDLLVGAPFNDLAGNNAGAVYVVLGGATLASSNLGTFPIFIGEVAGDEAGRTVAPAGDVNGDGFQDMLVGVMNHDAPVSNAGAVYLILGGSSISSGSLGSRIKYTGEAVNDFAGSSIDAAGDVNGDGYMDFVVGAPQNDDGANQGGSAYIILGSASPASGSLGSHLQYASNISFNAAGQEVSGAGDFNGDGYADVAVSAAGASAAVYLIWGSATPISSPLTGGISYSGAHGNNTLSQAKYLAYAGDINADGYGDILIGAESEISSTGAVYIAYGTPNPVNTTISSLPRLGGAAASDLFGFAVRGNGDVNGDGLADIILSTLGNDEAGNNAGGAYLLFGDQIPLAYRERQRLTPAGNLPAILFDTMGVRVDFSAGALVGGDVTVTRHLYHPCATDIRLQTPIWSIDSPKIGPGTTLDIRFQYTNNQIAGMNEANLRVWTRPIGQPCAPWVQVPVSLVNPATNQITVLGYTDQGQFTLGDSQPSPTSIQELNLGVAGHRPPVYWGLALLTFTFITGVVLKPVVRHWRGRDLGE
ncbi:MAG: integrin alpha [Anaerolineae bacterium]|nr:integrin alpha [Anaerolineae bacterium]